MRTLELTPSPPGDAIGEIVQVFKDGCQAAEALRRTAGGLTAAELELQLNAIEQRMLQQISSICGDYLIDLPVMPVN